MTLHTVGDGMRLAESGAPGPRIAIAFGTHGDERAPIDAGLELVARIERGALELAAGTLLLVHSNPLASAQDRRWSEGGVDLNRCFHASVLAREPALFEERRARAIAAALDDHAIEALVDFHCTVEPGRRFLMQHPPALDEAHRAVTRWLRADVLLADPRLWFGGVSLDELLSTRGRVGVCYETGWIRDPANTPESVLDEMTNLLAGTGLVAGDATAHDEKRRLELDAVVRCEGDGFRWEDGVGENLQELRAGTRLGAYADGTPVELESDATLIFPKKKPELVERKKPLVYLAARRG